MDGPGLLRTRRLVRPVRPVRPVRVPHRFFLVAVALPAALFLSANAALRLTYPWAVSRDYAELLLFTQAPAWGYHDMPPLYSWLLHAGVGVLGVGVLPFVLIRFALLFAISVLLYLCARQLGPDRRLAALAAHSVLLLPALAWNGVGYLTHTNLLIASCLWTLYAALRLVRAGRTRDYLALGAALGAAALSKYNVVWFVAALLAAAVTVPAARRRLFDRRVLLTAAVAGLIVLPHGVWLYRHWGEVRAALVYKAAGAPAEAPAARVLHSLTGLAAPFLLLAGPLALFVLATFRGPARAPDPARTLVARFLVAGLLVVFVQFVQLGAHKVQDRWLTHLGVVLPLWLFARVDPSAATAARVRRFAGLLVAVALVYTAGRACLVASPPARGYGWHPIKVSEIDLARQIAAAAGDRPTIVTRSVRTAGNLRLHLPAARVCALETHALYPMPPGAGPVVVVWEEPVAAPPWAQFEPVLPGCAAAPPPHGPVHAIETAPGAPGRRAPSVARFAVLAP